MSQDKHFQDVTSDFEDMASHSRDFSHELEA